MSLDPIFLAWIAALAIIASYIIGGALTLVGPDYRFKLIGAIILVTAFSSNLYMIGLAFDINAMGGLK